MPVGPSSLWPEKTKKSQSERLHVHGQVRHRLGAVHQHRHPRGAPARRSRAPGSPCRARWTRGRPRRACRGRAAARTRRGPARRGRSSARPEHAPVCSHSSCQGTMLEWCSMPVTRISSPAGRCRPQLCATRLIASVCPAGEDDLARRRALRKRATFARAFVRGRRPLAQVVDAAMDVGVLG